MAWSESTPGDAADGERRFHLSRIMWAWFFGAGWAALVTHDWHVYLHHLSRGQVPLGYLELAVHKLALDFGMHYVIVEAKQSGQAIAQKWANIFSDVRNPPNLVEWQPFGQRGSPTRLEANERIAGFLIQKSVHLPSEHYARRHNIDWLEITEQELFSYPEGESDDIADALFQMLFWIDIQKQRGIATSRLPREIAFAEPTGRIVQV